MSISLCTRRTVWREWVQGQVTIGTLVTLFRMEGTVSWKTKGLEHLREEFVILAERPKFNERQLCNEFGISRKTGYNERALAL